MRDLFRNHVKQWLPAYRDRQLSAVQRQRVARHLAVCADCRAALAHEDQTARELAAVFPLIGQPAPGQLRRLWPAIWTEMRRVPQRPAHWMPSAGVLLAALLISAFSVSALFSGTTHANAAPQPFVPSDIRATNTPVRTDDPGVLVMEVRSPRASQTASVSDAPQPSPAPPPVQWGGAANP